MKKRWILLMAIAMLAAFSVGVVAKTTFDVITAEVRTDFTIEIDGVKRTFRNANGDKVYPILHEGTTYLPLRAIGEIMNKDVYWFEDDKRIELKDKTEQTTVTDADVIVTDDKKDKKPKTNDNQKVDETNFIGQDKAKAIALEKAGLSETDVSFVKVELDHERGIPVYEVEFKQDKNEYNAEINAADGTILEWDVEFDD